MGLTAIMGVMPSVDCALTHIEGQNNEHGYSSYSTQYLSLTHGAKYLLNTAL